MRIKKQQSIDVEENIQERIQDIFDVAKYYGFLEIVRKSLTIHVNEEATKMSYILDISKLKFLEYQQFQMRLSENGFAYIGEPAVTRVQKYTYHGFHLINPKIHFIRFDYEPFKEKYAPLHINANKKIWGDHLVFPDDTNLDISKMSLPISLKIFERYAKNKNDYPTNQETNEPYVEIITKGAKT